MKDNFVHCRIAGLKTAIACVKLMDVQQLATKIIPQVAILLLDKHNDVRTYSLTLMDASMERMRAYHEHLLQSTKDTPSKEEERRSSVSGATEAASSGASSASGSNVLSSPMIESWTSWGIQGISKTLDMDVGGTSGVEKRIGEINISNTPNAGKKLSTQAPAVTANSRSTKNSFGDEDDNVASRNNDNGLDDSEHFFEARSFPPSKSGASNGDGAGVNSWGDDDLDSALRFDDDDMGLDDSGNGSFGQHTPGAKTKPSTSTASSNASGGGLLGSLGAPSSTHSSSSNFGSNTVPKVNSFGSDISSQGASSKVPAGITSTTSKKKVEKAAVKKLEFNKEDDWEDF